MNHRTGLNRTILNTATALAVLLATQAALGVTAYTTRNGFELFSIDFDDNATTTDTNNLPALNPQFIGNMDVNQVHSLAFHPDGTLYGLDVDLDNLVIIDPSNADVTVVGSLGTNVVGRTDLVIDDQGLALMTDSTGSANGAVRTVNLATGEASPAAGNEYFGSTQDDQDVLDGAEEVTGIGFLPGNTFFGFGIDAGNGGRLFTLLGNGAISTIGAIGLFTDTQANTAFAGAGGTIFALSDDFDLTPGGGVTSVYKFTQPTGQNADPMAVEFFGGLDGLFEGLAIRDDAVRNQFVPEPLTASLAMMGIVSLASAVSRRR